MTIAIFGNTFSPTVLNILDTIFQYFREKEVSLVVDKQLINYYCKQRKDRDCQYDILDDIHLKADYALSIGGDGTFLHTAARIGSKAIPIMGINTGRLGFLTDVAVDEVEKAMDAIVEIGRAHV